MVMRVRITTSGSYLLVWEKKQARQTFRRAGAEILSAARSKLKKSGAGRTYSIRGGKYVASAPGEPPAVRTGAMRRSGKVSVFKSGMGVAVRFRAWYSNVLEHGARASGARKAPGGTWARRRGADSGPLVLAPRPFLSAALAERGPSVQQRVRDAIIEGIEFRRVGPGRK